MVGHPGAAPGVSPIRTARIAVFLVPDMKCPRNGGATGNRTPICAMPLRRPAVGRWPRKTENSYGDAPGGGFRYGCRALMMHWKALLLVYRAIDVRISVGWFRK